MTNVVSRRLRCGLRSTVYSAFGFWAVCGMAAQAQEAGALETVVVSGYRATIQSSIEAKRASAVIEDGLSTKDIGALPSLSIGSALETIPGAAGSPDNTGATQFAIRGLGSYLGLTTFNGRDITNGSGDRSVNFSVFPSELMSGLKLYKSQEADFVEGAVSGLTDLSLVHPLDINKRVVKLELKGSYNPVAYRVDSNRTQPGVRGTAQYVDQFNIGKFGRLGVTIGGQHDEANNAQEIFASSSGTRYACSTKVSTGKCTSYTTAGFATAGTSYAEQLAAGKATDFYLVPSSYQFQQTADESHRDAVFGALQWQPNDKIEVNIDGEFSGYYSQQDQQYLVFANGNYNLHNVAYDDHVPQSMDGSTQLYSKPNYHTRDEIYTGGGINVAWTPIDRLTVKADYGYSHTYRRTTDRSFYLYAGYLKPTTKNGVTTYATTPSNLYVNYNYSTANGDIPAFTNLTDTTDLDAAHGAGSFDVNSYDRFNTQPRFSRENESRFDTISAYRLDADYDVGGWVKTVSVGVRYSERAYRYFDDNHGISLNSTSLYTLNTPSDSSFMALSGGKYVYKNPTTGADWYTTTLAANQACRTDFGESNFLNTGGNTIHSWATFNNSCLYKQFFGADDVGPFDAQNRSGLSTQVRETTWSGYAMAKFVVPLGSHALSGNVGGRVVSTTEASSGLSSQYASVAVASSSGTTYQFNPVPGSFTPSALGGSATSVRFLPSINLSYDLSDDVTLRAAVARTMSRPALSALGTGVTLAADTSTVGYAKPIDAVKAGTLTVDGNYALKPLMSWNYNLSTEYYMNADSMFSASLYYNNFSGGYDVASGTTKINLDGVDYAMPYQQIINSSRKSYVYGVELQAITRFDFLPHPLDGLGAKVGYNYAVSNFSNDDIYLGNATNPETGVVTPGMIPQANMSEYSPHVVSAQLYYDLGPFSAQAILTHRSHWYQDFLGGNTQLRYYRANTRLDVRASYDITSNLQIDANVYNVLNTPVVMDMPVVGDIRQYSVYGPRYYMSVKYRM